MSSVDQQLEDLSATIDQQLPDDITITGVAFEGPELVIYTEDPRRFADDAALIRNLASRLRKRITIRPDPESLVPPEIAASKVREVIPEDAGVTEMDFHPDTGEVVIEAEKPGLVIGRGGSTLREVTQAVGWTPEAVRTPPISSSTASHIRNILQQKREERRASSQTAGRDS